MVQKSISDDGFPASRPGRLFHPVEEPLARFPIQSVRIDWDRQVVDLQLKLTQDARSWRRLSPFAAVSFLFVDCRMF